MVALPGVFSNIDTDTLISGLMELEQKPLALLSQKKATQQTRQAGVVAVEAALSSLRAAAFNLQGTDALRSVTSSSTNTSIVEASAGNAGAEGVHSLEVNRLASAQRMVQSVGLAGSDSTVGVARSTALNTNGVADADADWFTVSAESAEYTFSFAGETAIDTVTFDANTTYSMNEVAARINARSQLLSGYDAASVELDSQTGQYYLRLTASSTDTVSGLTQSLTSGQAVAELNDDADWLKTSRGAGEMVYTYDGVTRTVRLGDGGTLENLRDLINTDSQNPGVTASILEYGGTYHLVLSGNDTGEDHAITIDNLRTTIAGFDTADFLVTRQAQNCQFRLDGFPPEGQWMERSSNTVTDVLDGVSLTLRGEGSASVTLSRDLSALKSDLQGLVSAYNSVADKIRALTSYDSANQIRGPLQGDGTMAALLSAIRSPMVSAPQGYAAGAGDSFTLPGQIGLEFDKKGNLSFNESVFDEAIAEDYTGVLALIGARYVGASDSDSIRFSSASSNTAPGQYQVQVDFDASGNILEARYRTSDAGEWQMMQVNGNTLMGLEDTDGEDLELAVSWLGSAGTQSANVWVRQGLACSAYETLDDVLDPVTGTVKIKKDQMESSISQLNDQITAMQARIDRQTENLREKFARLEKTLSQLESQRASVTAMLNSLSTGSSSSSSSSSSQK